jgi:hypothetical protein
MFGLSKCGDGERETLSNAGWMDAFGVSASVSRRVGFGQPLHKPHTDLKSFTTQADPTASATWRSSRSTKHISLPQPVHLLTVSSAT